MYIPNGWKRRDESQRLTYNHEGKLQVENLSRQSTGGIGRANSRFATEAEEFDSIAPFLAQNRAVDAERRNYVIQPGGACLYFANEERLAEPYAHNRAQFDGPDDRESFGHNQVSASGGAR